MPTKRSLLTTCRDEDVLWTTTREKQKDLVGTALHACVRAIEWQAHMALQFRVGRAEHL